MTDAALVCIITGVITFQVNRMFTLKLTQIGNSVVVLPKELLAKLKLDKGDSLYVTDLPHGMRITSHDPASRKCGSRVS